MVRRLRERNTHGYRSVETSAAGATRPDQANRALRNPCRLARDEGGRRSDDACDLVTADRVGGAGHLRVLATSSAARDGGRRQANALNGRRTTASIQSSGPKFHG